MKQQAPPQAAVKATTGVQRRLQRVEQRVFFVSQEEAAVIGKIRTVTRKVLTTWYLAAIVVSPALFLAVIAPAVIDQYSFLDRLLGTFTYTVAVFFFNQHFGAILQAKLARRGFVHLYSMMIGHVIWSLILAPTIIPFFRPDIVETFGYLYVYSAAALVTSVLCWAVGFVFASLWEERLQEVFQSEGCDIDVLPKFIDQQDDPKLEPLQAQLPFSIRGPIRSVSAQDKYVEVTTENGKHLLTMSLTQAIDQLGIASGLRVHRSTWLSWDSMDRIIYENGNPRVVCTCGQIQPVSRKHVKHLKSRLGKKSGAAR